MASGSISARISSGLVILSLFLSGGCAGGRSGTNSGNGLRFVVTFVTVDQAGAPVSGIQYKHFESGQEKTTDETGVVEFQLTTASTLQFEASSDLLVDQVDLGSADEYNPDKELNALVEVSDESIDVKAINTKSDEDNRPADTDKKVAPDPVRDESTPEKKGDDKGKPKDKQQPEPPAVEPTPNPTPESTPPPPPTTEELTLTGSNPPENVIFADDDESKTVDLYGKGFTEQGMFLRVRFPGTPRVTNLPYRFFNPEHIRFRVAAVEADVCLELENEKGEKSDCLFLKFSKVAISGNPVPAPSPGSEVPEESYNEDVVADDTPTEVAPNSSGL